MSSDEPVVVFVPYRDRPKGWEVFMAEVAPLFPPGSLIVRATQSPQGRFNRGKVLNAAFKWWSETRRDGSKTREIFLHDVDTIPTSRETRRRYRMPAERGVVALITGHRRNLAMVTRMRARTYERMCGFCNDYWGWGYEDEILYYRAVAFGAPITVLQRIWGHGSAGWTFVDESGGASDKTNVDRLKDVTMEVRKMMAEDARAHARMNGLEQCNYRVIKEEELSPNVISLELDLLPDISPAV